MKKQKNMRCVLRCIRIPHGIDHKINQICQDREMNYSQCVRMFISQGIKAGETQEEDRNGRNVAEDVWAWANNQNHTT
ncbi:hypothetical protein ACLB1N_35280 [Escherichia coli]